METIGAIVACIAALAAGFEGGRRWALDQGWSVFIGAAVAEACTAIYFIVMLAIDVAQPGLVNAHIVGQLVVMLVAVTALLGATAGWFGFRRSMRRFF
ncbi:MAG TPA: hypothetical protein VMI56_03100 [Reyranella sp.]|nr:hypothetical protein [Reyranella sp.]